MCSEGYLHVADVNPDLTVVLPYRVLSLLGFFISELRMMITTFIVTHHDQTCACTTDLIALHSLGFISGFCSRGAKI